LAQNRLTIAHIIALGEKAKREAGVSNLTEYLEKYGIPSSTENRHRKEFMSYAEQFREEKEKDDVSRCETVKKAAIELSGFFRDCPGAVQKNSQRQSYSLKLKEKLHEIKGKYSLTYEELSEISEIPKGTLEKIQMNIDLAREEPPAIYGTVGEVFSDAPRSSRSSLKAFWSYLGTHHPEMDISFDKMRSILIDLGLWTPRGIAPKNDGAGSHRPVPFNTLWGGDGKTINIYINGQRFKWCWYAFTDHQSSLLVGCSISENESVASIEDALKNAKERGGCTPIAILLDNRIDEHDKNCSLANFCKENGITIVRTFPGNSKSNGIIEANFKIFEDYVGDIRVVGSTPEALSASISKAILEVFTQQRNHQARKRKGGRSAQDIANGCNGDPQKFEEYISHLAERLKAESTSIEQKWELIQDARKHFVGTEKQQERLKSQLEQYSLDELAAAQAAYLARIKAYPSNSYTEHYFMGILRRKREELLKKTYTDSFRSTMQRAVDLTAGSIDTEDALEAILDKIKGLKDLKTKAAKLLSLDGISTWMSRNCNHIDVSQLWEKVGDKVRKDSAITYRTWQQVNEHVTESIRGILYPSERLAYSGATPRQGAFTASWQDQDNLCPAKAP